MKTRLLQIIGSWIWNTSESLDIPLKGFAPIVFGWMIGSEGKKVEKTEDEGNQ